VVVKKPTDKNTKVEILQAYEDLAKEKAALKSQLERVAKENQPETQEQPKLEQKIPMNQLSSVQQKMNNTIESLAKIQLGFGSAANELSEHLTTKASNLEEIRRNLEAEIQQLTQLHNLEISDDILDTLIQALSLIHI
jgi:hypothetical protein